MGEEKVSERFTKNNPMGEEQSKLNNKFLKLLLLVVFLNLFSFASFGIECSFDTSTGILKISGGKDETVMAGDVDSALQIAIYEECIKIGINPNEDCGLTLEDMKNGVLTVELNNVRSIGDNTFFEFISLCKVIFDGTEEQWNKIKIGKGNEVLKEVTVYCINKGVGNTCIDFDKTTGRLHIYAGADGTVTAEDVESALYKYGLAEMRDAVEKVFLENVRKIGDNTFNQFS